MKITEVFPEMFEMTMGQFNHFVALGYDYDECLHSGVSVESAEDAIMDLSVNAENKGVVINRASVRTFLLTYS